MFVENLTKKTQKEAFLSLAKALIMADGKSTQTESLLLAELTRQLPDVSVNAKTVDAILANIKDKKGTGIKTVAKVFVSRKEKASVMLELLGIAIVDNKYQAKEKQLISKVAEALGLSELEMSQFESWISVQFELTKMVGSFMQEEE